MKNHLATFEDETGMICQYIVPGTGVGQVTRVVESYCEENGLSIGHVHVQTVEDLKRLIQLLESSDTVSDIPPEYIPGA